MLDTSIQKNFSSPREMIRPHGYVEKPTSFHKKFSYENYREAHQWLDSIFDNGCPINPYTSEKPYVCWECGGKCCTYIPDADANTGIPNMTIKEKPLPSMVWNEHIYFQDVEFKEGAFENLICHRSDPKNCLNKMIICKVHPFYPAKIHILEEECNYSIHLNASLNERRLCSNIDFEEWQMEELSKFYQWIYGNFPENRLIYIAHSLISVSQNAISSTKVLSELLHGDDCSQNIIFRA